jgi:hypothetical protein
MSDKIPGDAITRYVGDDACVACEGLGWRFPTKRDYADRAEEPKIDGVVSYQAMPCAECGQIGHHATYRRLGWGGVR